MKTSFTKKEHLESGLVLILLLLLVSVSFHSMLIVKIAMGALVLDLLLPVVFYPFSFVWLNLSLLLGKISTAVLLTGIFLFVVTPVGVFRKLLGKNRLHLSDFKKSDITAFETRNHLFIKEDLLHPF